MPLPLVKKRGGGGGHLPSAETLTQCMRLSSTAEAATYLYQQAKVLLASLLSQEPVRKVVGVLEAHANNVEMIKGKGTDNLWAGKQLPTDFEEVQRKSAADAGEAIKKIVGDKPISKLALDFAVSNASQLLRGYSINGKSLGGDLVAAMDKLFNAWLADNNMLSKGGVIFEGTKDGQIKQDGQGNPVKADAENLREKIVNKEDGFEPYVQKHSKSTQITIQQQPYPTQQAELEDTGPSSGAGAAGGGH